MYKKIALTILLAITFRASNASNEDAPSTNLTENVTVATVEQVKATENTQTNNARRKRFAGFAAAIIAAGYGVKRYIISSPEEPALPQIPTPPAPKTFFTPGCHAKKNFNKSVIEDFSDISHESTPRLYGVYDGHGGPQVAEYVAKNLNKKILEKIASGVSHKQALRLSYLEVDAELSQHLSHNVCLNQGTTAITALVEREYFWVANTGDSRAVYAWQRQAMIISFDHKPDRTDEKKRIEDAGGTVFKLPRSSVFRVDGDLAMSRAIGDHRFIYPNGKRSVIPNPELGYHSRSEDDSFLILASDGVWDVMNNQRAVNIVQIALKSGCTPNQAAQKLVEAASNAGSRDDITVLIVPLQDYAHRKQNSSKKPIHGNPESGQSSRIFSPKNILLSTTAASMFITALYYSFAPERVAATQ